MSLEILRKIGLSEGELRVYSVLLNSGRSALNTIHEKVGMERRNIYDVLNKLIEKGIVTYVTENRKRYFQVAHPSKIISYVEEKENDLSQTKNAVEAAMPEIIKKFQSRQSSANAEIYRGVEGNKAVWDDMLNYSDIYWIGSGRYVPKRFPHYFAVWNKKRIAKKIKLHNIFRGELKSEVTLYQYEQGKFLPKEFSNNPVVIGIHGHRVAHFLYGEEIFVFVIESKELAENYKAYHAYLWNNVCTK